MSFVVAIISFEQELSKETFLQQVSVALDFIRSHSKMRILACENSFEIAMVFKAECDKYIQIDTQEPAKFLVPIIDVDTGLEELIESKFLDNVEHIPLTTCDSRKHDRVRDDLSLLLTRPNGVNELVNVLESEGIFYE